jgi:hypothetical protein
MRYAGANRQDVVRWNQTALIWVMAFWAPVLGAFAHLLFQAPDGLARDAALVYVAALAMGLAALTAVCVGAHALLLVGLRWLGIQPQAWRRPAAVGLSVVVGWLLAYGWTAGATRLAHAFSAPQPLPDALAYVVGVGIALAYVAVGLAAAGVPLLAGLLPERAAGESARPVRVPAPGTSAPRLIAPKPYPFAVPATAVPQAPAAAPPAPPLPQPLALDTPLLLRYPRQSAALAATPAPRSEAGRAVRSAAPEPDALAVAEPPSVPVVAPRTVPVLRSTPAAGAGRIAIEFYTEEALEDRPTA